MLSDEAADRAALDAAEDARIDAYLLDLDSSAMEDAA